MKSILLPLATKRIVRTTNDAFSVAAEARSRMYVCQPCRLSSSDTRIQASKYQAGAGRVGGSRWFSLAARYRVEEKGRSERVIASKAEAIDAQQEDISAIKNTPVHVAPEENLPSHREKLRWWISKRANELMDDLMPKLALATQRINTYTGTDYSGIEALRKEIIEQEKLVKSRHTALQIAKEAYEIARAEEIKSRKEVVALLERRHGWSDGDLERYMSLIRSEHLNDQAVQNAKDAMSIAERSLEEARSRLEKRERMQYHEEQIWSDTIRRNSTWVTFGLMGVNMMLLLVTMVGIEPWRRKRMVREIKQALEEQRLGQENLVLAREAEKAVEAEEVPTVVVEDVENTPSTEASIPLTSTSPPKEEVSPEQPQLPEHPDLPELVIIGERLSTPDTWKMKALDFFSDRSVTLRKVDVSSLALESAAIGATFVGLLVLLFRNR